MPRMPLFDFACRSCGKRFEDLVRGGETPRCPDCESIDLEKLLSPFAVQGGGGAPSDEGPCGNPCGTCGDPRGPGACSTD
jgi:putative FmdB family regulatory protein